MKKILCLSLLLSLLLIVGCNQGVSGGGGVTKYTSFLGVSFGMTKTQVAAVLGSGTDLPITAGVDLVGYIAGHVVGFLSDKARLISTLVAGSGLEGISVGSTKSEVETALGTPSSNLDDSIRYNWFYSDRNIWVEIDKTTNKVLTLGIYDSDTIDPSDFVD